MGLGPLDARPGDRVSILGQGPVSFLLRQGEADDNGAYTIIGECYIHGIMDGELWRVDTEKGEGDHKECEGLKGIEVEIV